MRMFGLVTTRELLQSLQVPATLCCFVPRQVLLADVGFEQFKSSPAKENGEQENRGVSTLGPAASELLK